MNKNKKTERKKTTQNRALAFSETSGPAVPQCGVLQPRGSAGCGVRGTAQADPGVAGPENSQEGKNSGEQISSVPFLLKPANSPCPLTKLPFLFRVCDSLKSSKLLYFQTVCQYKKAPNRSLGVLEWDWWYICVQYQIYLGSFSKCTQLCLFLNNLALILTPTQLKTTLRKCNKLLDLKIFGMDVVVWWYFTTGSMELEDLWFVAFAVFCGVSIPTMADFMRPV